MRKAWARVLNGGHSRYEGKKVAGLAVKSDKQT